MTNLGRVLKYRRTLDFWHVSRKSCITTSKKKNSIDITKDGFDIHVYKVRHLIENLFARFKQIRSIATRYDKSKNDFASIIYMRCWII